MKNTILIDLADRVMTCRVCKDQTEIPRRLIFRQDGVLEMHEYLGEDHRECAATPNDPELARKNRGWRKRVEAEEQKAAKRAA